MRWMWIVVAALIGAWTPGADADEPRGTLELKSVLVSPRRIPELFVSASEVPGNTTVITADDLAHSGARTIQDALAQAEGVILLDQQGFGLASDGTLNLRGMVNSARTDILVLVDGIRQNRITGDEVHWQGIPLKDIERIEILRGGGGLIYGEGALAGVINIMTKKDAVTALETEGGVEFGSFGWQQYHTAARGRRHPFTYGVSYTRRLVDGYRESSWSRNTTLDFHTGLEVTPALMWQVNVLHSEDVTAFPGGLTLAQVEHRRRQAGSFHGFNNNAIDQVSLDTVLGPWEGLSGVVNIFWRRWVQTSEDSIQFDAFTITPSRGLSARTNYEWIGETAKDLIVSGLELMDEKATTGDRDAFPGPDNESNRAGYGLYAENTLTLLERLSLVTGLRFDKFRYQEAISFPSFEGTLRFQGFSPKAGLTYALVPNVVDLFASYSRPFKAPNVDDFTARVPDFAGNVDLKPQQADAYELGLRLTKAPLRANATWFYTKMTDEILFNQLAFQNQNFDTRRLGVEFGTRFELPDQLRTYVTYTVVDAEFRKGQFAGNTIPGTPTHLLNAGGGFSPVKGFWIDLDWQLVNDFYRINDFRNILPKADNYGVLNLKLEYENPTVRMFVKIENLTNEEYVSFQSSNASNLLGAGESPSPPTTFVGGVTLKF